MSICCDGRGRQRLVCRLDNALHAIKIRIPPLCNRHEAYITGGRNQETEGELELDGGRRKAAMQELADQSAERLHLPPDRIVRTR